MRCAWCPAPAIWYVYDATTVPTCKAHVHLSEGTTDARVKMARPWWQRWRDDATLDSRVEYCAIQVDRRDARELRGEPPSMEGWTIFGEGGA